jgi:hypothetical protein
MKKKTVFRVVLIVLCVLCTAMVLGAKGCEVNTKADILEVMPEILEIAPDLTIDTSKFDIRKYSGVIALTTYDNMSFLEAIKKLKIETPMNIPIRIFYGERISSEGEFKTEQPVDAVIALNGGNLRPYLGIIHIRDGWWTAIEFDAASLFTKGKEYPISLLLTDGNNDDKVLVTEYAYANETVYNLNGWSSRGGILSDFDTSTDRRGTVKGDGSMPNDIISVFDKR